MTAHSACRRPPQWSARDGRNGPCNRAEKRWVGPAGRLLPRFPSRECHEFGQPLFSVHTTCILKPPVPVPVPCTHYPVTPCTCTLYTLSYNPLYLYPVHAIL